MVEFSSYECRRNRRFKQQSVENQTIKLLTNIKGVGTFRKILIG